MEREKERERQRNRERGIRTHNVRPIKIFISDDRKSHVHTALP